MSIQFLIKERRVRSSAMPFCNKYFINWSLALNAEWPITRCCKGRRICKRKCQ